VRRTALLAVLALALAGCGGDRETTTVTVATTVGAETTPPRLFLPSPLTEDGTLPVDVYNAYAETIVEHWEHDLGSVLSTFVAAGLTDAARRSFEATTRGEGSAATATLILDGLLDDSIRALRYDVEARRLSGGAWELVSATWSQRCRAGRGHQDFSPEPCV
jgi:hypothetical protein